MRSEERARVVVVQREWSERVCKSGGDTTRRGGSDVERVAKRMMEVAVRAPFYRASCGAPSSSSFISVAIVSEPSLY